ncbi:hypothetical protein JQ570_28715 [Bradyrhizobium liaoningense]|nr:hypothetical protein [Bradyrhizobium liaoningense]
MGFEHDHIFAAIMTTRSRRRVDVRLAHRGIGQDVDIVRLNYRWGGPVVAKY